MRNKILLGVSKIILAGLILFLTFTAQGPQKPLGIWLGCVISFPIILWGIIDFIKKPETPEEKEKKNNDD